MAVNYFWLADFEFEKMVRNWLLDYNIECMTFKMTHFRRHDKFLLNMKNKIRHFECHALILNFHWTFQPYSTKTHKLRGLKLCL
jgi:hypothetical protein